MFDEALLFDSEVLYCLKPVLQFRSHVFNENLARWKSLAVKSSSSPSPLQSNGEPTQQTSQEQPPPLSPFLIRTVSNMLEVKAL